jgi:hypothetical protein
MRRITLNLKPEQADALQKRAADTGVLVSEQIRRAIDASLTPRRPRAAQPAPVLITKVAE